MAEEDTRTVVTTQYTVDRLAHAVVVSRSYGSSSFHVTIREEDQPGVLADPAAGIEAFLTRMTAGL